MGKARRGGRRQAGIGVAIRKKTDPGSARSAGEPALRSDEMSEFGSANSSEEKIMRLIGQSPARSGSDYFVESRGLQGPGTTVAQCICWAAMQAHLSPPKRTRQVESQEEAGIYPVLQNSIAADVQGRARHTERGAEQKRDLPVLRRWATRPNKRGLRGRTGGRGGEVRGGSGNPS